MAKLRHTEVIKLNIKYRIDDSDFDIFRYNIKLERIPVHVFLINSIYFTSNIEYEDSLTLDKTKIAVKEILKIGNKEFKNKNKTREDIIVSNGVLFYDLLFDLLKKNSHLSQSIIRKLHGSLTRQLNRDDSWIPGQYRLFEATIAGRELEVFFTKPEKIHEEMEDLIEDINKFIDYKFNSKEEALDQALKLKAKFIRIHPFGDGNGRMARGLLQFLLGIKGLPLPMFKTWNRKDYHNAMHIAYKTNGNMGIVKKMYLDEIKNYILDKKELSSLEW